MARKRSNKRTKKQKMLRQQKRRKRMIRLMGIIIIILGVIIYNSCLRVVDISNFDYPSYITQDFILQDGHSRTGQKLRQVNDIVIHYVGNPGSTAQANRDYFNSSKSTTSSHFVVGLQGEVIQCVPLDEKSSASNDRNRDTISIEVCHPDSSGKFNSTTYARLVELTAWLCEEFNLDENDLIRHYDVTGKSCPKYYVEHPDAWEQFKEDVGAELK